MCMGIHVLKIQLGTIRAKKHKTVRKEINTIWQIYIHGYVSRIVYSKLKELNQVYVATG